MQNLLPFLFIGALEVYFLALLFMMLKVSFIGIRSKKWPTTQGEIIISEAEEENRLLTGVIAKKQRVSIGYRYTVNGRTFERTTVSAGEYINASRLWNAKNAKQMLSKYPLSHEVTVYYDSDRPGRAVLEPGIDINLVLSLLIILLGVLFFPVMLLFIN